MLKSIQKSFRASPSRGWMVGAFTALTVWGAQAADIPFNVQLSGGNVVTFKVTNESGEPITGVKVTVGNTAYHFDHSYKDIPAGQNGSIDSYSFATTGRRNDTLLALEGFDSRETLTFYIDVDTDGQNDVVDFRTIFFNNGSSIANAEVTVYNKDGESEVLRLSDGAGGLSAYSFKSDSRPPVISVRSIAGIDQDGKPVYVANCRVTINGILARDSSGVETKNIGREVEIAAYAGDIVEITAPQLVYQDNADNYLTDSGNPDADKILAAMQRFAAIGISVNDVPQTGDPTLYRFEAVKDAQISVKWRHDYALRVKSDFLNTRSDLVDASNTPWAGPVHSEATGNPLPSVKLHWVASGELLTAAVDGQVIDYSHPGLGIRYVPVGYRATGSANGTDMSVMNVHNFTVGQAPPLRQQIQQFTMNGPAIIDYIWQIQFGVTVNVDDAARAQAPLIQEFEANGTTLAQTYYGQGTYWFNPQVKLKVLSIANEESAEEKALAGWINGDGYYFKSSGDVFSPDGSLLVGDPDAADWITNEDVGGSLYHGLDINKDRIGSGITGLSRPIRVMWTYGNQAIAVTVPIGQYVLQTPVTAAGTTYNGASFLQQPEQIKMITITGKNTSIAEADMSIWDPVAAKLYPLVPGIFRATWSPTAEPDRKIDVIVTAILPQEAHYPHIADAPAVNMDPSSTDDFIFKALKYSENAASVDNNAGFFCSQPGWSVLLFGEIQQQGRGQPAEYLRVRTVRTDKWEDKLAATQTAIIGQQIKDPALDLAKLDTGYVLFENARYNPLVYDATQLDGLGAPAVYDMALLNSTTHEKVVSQRQNLPGPVIPVNLHPGAAADERIAMVWYDDPSVNDNLLWPHAVRIYNPRWPVNASEGLGRIVIASQFGSESVDTAGNDQMTAEAITNLVSDGVGGTVENITPSEIMFNPTRLQGAIIYNQPDAALAGYNPNEEHALMAPSLRYAKVSPRPSAAYAMRDNDLNKTGANYTSDPYVLVQYFDTADSIFKMKIYTIQAEDNSIGNYSFAQSSLWASTPNSTRLRQEPFVEMEAGEPVIPFYPLGVVIGAVPTAETFGDNITSQLTYWEDHKGTSWSVSGGADAWFTQSPYYPLQPDFWWEDGKSGMIVADSKGTLTAAEPQVGHSLSFLPNKIGDLQAVAPSSPVQASLVSDMNPTEILYHSKWPDILPILKAGETLTFSGGEYRADHPTSLTADENGDLKTVETPGLPGVLAFAVAEVAYDSLNPTGNTGKLLTDWTARIAQVLEKRTATMAFVDFPSALSPASGRTRISQGKYVFSELPASLQKRFRFDPIGGRIEISGLLNDKDIAEDTLTASPPAVYVLEPNIMTAVDRDALLALSTETKWRTAVRNLYTASLNPDALEGSSSGYLVGIQRKIVRNAVTQEPELVQIEPGSDVMIPVRENGTPESLRAFGPGLALLPNASFLDPLTSLPDYSYVSVVENNDPSLGGSPVTIHVIKVDRTTRYRGSVKTVLSDNVFDENVVLRHTGDFGANADDLFVEWWYRPDDGSLNVPPPDLIPAGQTNPWKIFPDVTGNRGQGQYEITLKGNPNAPEALLADTWWFARYRHKNDIVDGVDWAVQQPDLTDEVNFTWAGAGNSDPFNDFDLNGILDFKAQLAMGWIKRVLDAVNPYEARIRDFEGDSPSTVSSMIQEFGARFEGPVALNPDKNVIENVGLIELYETVLKRGRDLSIDLSRPVSTPAIANALQLASTRISDFYMLLANEAYTDALNPTIGFGSSSVEYGHLAPAIFTFQNQMSSPIEEELALLRGVDDYFARPVFNRLFWNFTKGEGEAAYALNYNITDINADGFIDEDDAMSLFPQGHGDAWGHYLTALRNQYELLNHDYFNWVSRSEFYNLMDIVIKVDFLDERKFAQTAAAKAKAAAEIVDLTYREKYVTDPTAQWQGYTDSNPDRAWGVQGWARRTAQGAYFDWVTANALLPADHPNTTLEGIQKVDRASNGDIAVISANLNKIQRTFDNANKGYSPLGLDKDVMAFDLEPIPKRGGAYPTTSHFNQIYDRAVAALNNAKASWDKANQVDNMLRKVGNTEADFRNSVFQEDLTYKNRLIKIFGRPYEGTIGSGQLYPAGYDGPDLALHMYVGVREINGSTVPGPSTSFAAFNSSGTLTNSDIYAAFNTDDQGHRALSLSDSWRDLYSPTFANDASGNNPAKAADGWYSVEYTDLENPKVGLVGLTDLMPVTTAGYTFQAPNAWGNRIAVGELQTTLQQMIQQEAKIAEAIGAWDALTGEIIRTLRVVDARIFVADEIALEKEIFNRFKVYIESTIKGLQAASTLIQAIRDTATKAVTSGKEALPLNLPTGGLAISPGDALAPARAGIAFIDVATFTGFTAADAVVTAVAAGFDIAFTIAETEIELWEGRETLKLEKKEWLKEIEDLVGDEPVLRITIFKEIEALRQLSDRYRTLVDEGSRLVDERAAFNKRVAAKTQLNRYQDMTFRVSRNHALQTYRNSFDLAARYVYLAARAYDYETNFDPSDPASSQPLMSSIVKARGLGLIDNGPQIGTGGLAGVLATLKANYEVVSAQIGIHNPQIETGKVSMRSELFRILPKGAAQPVGIDSFPSPGGDSDDLWKQTMNLSRVDDLWNLSEFRRHCRPFAAEFDEAGEHVAQPGLVVRFSTDITSGNNVFGQALSGADHAYDPSVFATKIFSAGVWFSDYLSEDVLNDLPEAPRVYLVPIGLDIMSVPTSANPNEVREWNIVDQRIPVPVPAVGSDLDRADWIPLFDSLSGQYGEQRRFSSFRAYHDGGVLVDGQELVTDTRLFGRSVWNTQWMLIIPGATLNADPEEGLRRFIEQVSDIKLVFETYGISGN